MTTGEDGSEQAGLRRWRALGSWSASLAGRLVLLAAAVTGLVLLARWIDGQADDWRSEHLAIVLITAALAVISWPLGYRAGWRLRSWVDRGKVGKPEWRIVGVKHAAGVMAAWSVLYGTVFLVVAAAILWRWPVSSTSMWAWQAALATAVVFAVLLLYVLPLAVILTAVPLTVRRLVAEVDAELLTWPDRVLPPAAVVDLLRRRDLGHRCLLRRARTLTPTGEARRATWQRFCDSGSGWLAPPIRNVGITRLARRLYSKPDSGRLALAAGGRRLDLRLLKHVKKVRQQTSG